MQEQNVVEKSVEQRIVDTELLLKQVISESSLNVSVIELIVRNLYNEVRMLAQENLNNKLAELQKQQEEQKEDIDGNSNEEG